MFLFLFSEKPHHEPDHPDFVPSVFVYFSMSNSSKSCDIGLERFSRSLKRTAKRVLQLDSTTPSTSKKATFEPTLPSATSASTSLYDHTHQTSYSVQRLWKIQLQWRNRLHRQLKTKTYPCILRLTTSGRKSANDRL